MMFDRSHQTKQVWIAKASSLAPAAAEDNQMTQGEELQTQFKKNKTIEVQVQDKAALQAQLDKSASPSQDKIPPYTEIVTYKGEGLLVLPQEPDMKSQYMMDLAFSYQNGTYFPHDAISSNVSGCPPTSQVKVNVQDWSLTTYAQDGTLKQRGGDQLFIYYEDPSIKETTCVARPTDHGNGTYSLEFTKSPSLNTNTTLGAKGRLIVWLEYSCGVGKIMRPFKDHWGTSGAILTNWTADDVPKPPMKQFVHPNLDKNIDLGQMKVVLVAGDSVMKQFVSPSFNKFYWKNLAYTKSSRTPPSPLLLRSYGAQLQKITQRLRRLRPLFNDPNNNVALVLGFAAWSLQKPFGNGDAPIPGQVYSDEDLFPEHTQALSVLIKQLRRRFPNLKIFWKTGEYMHLHVVARDKGNDWLKVKERLAYMSQHRTQLLYEKQKQLMRGLNIPILDMMEATYLMPDCHRVPGDTMHYDIQTNKMMISWFYPNGVNASLWN